MSIFERARLLGFGLLAATFVAGALAGAAIDRIVSEGPRAEAHDDERRDDGDRERRYIIDRVEMSKAQRATIDSLLDVRVHRMRAVWREVEPRLDAITDSARSEIMDVLTPEQRAEYESMLERRRGDRGDDRRREDQQDGRDPAADSAGDDGD